jgi:tRNA(fMet)-specific endonuclease VapC
MTRLLLDTSAYSAFMRGHPDVVENVQLADEIYVNPIVLGELLAGFTRGTRFRKNQAELSEFLSSTRVHVVDIDEGTASRYSVILNSLWKAGTPIPTNDLWISASAMQHGLQILTSDGHYLKVSQVIVEHFSV